MPPTSSSIKDPWDTEHSRFLQLHPNAIVHSDRLYTGVVHKGFDADATAEELIRRYPAFEEAEEHRKFLVRSISERFILKGERDDYFAPQQLWEEDDRITGKRCFLDGDGESDEEENDDEAPVTVTEGIDEPVVLKAVPKSVIGEEQLESDEQLARLLSDPVLPKRTTVEASSAVPISHQSAKDTAMTDDDLAELFGEQPDQPTIVITTPEPKVATPNNNNSLIEPAKDSDLPITLQATDHTTTITCDHADLQRILHSLDLSSDVPLTSISYTSVDGSLAVALLGYVKANDITIDGSSAGNGPDHPITIADAVTANAKASEQRFPTEEASHGNEWNIVSQRPHRPTVAFLSGSRTCGALLEEICWDPESVVATSMAYGDGRTLVVLVGEQLDQKPSKIASYSGPSDPAEQFLSFFDAVRKAKDIPKEHSELMSLLQIAHKDMIEAGTIDALTLVNDDATDSSDDEADITLPIRRKPQTSDSEHIAALKKRTLKVKKELERALEAEESITTRSMSFGKERMQQMLERPKADYINFSHVDSRQQKKLLSHDKENEAPINVQSHGRRRSTKQVSSFPVGFGSVLGNRTTGSVPTVNAAPTQKRKRAVTHEDEADDNDESEDDDSEVYVSKPQRKRKIAKTKANTTLNVEGNTKSKRKTKLEAKAPPTPMVVKGQKKPVHKATTAAESAQAISKITAQLAKFKVPSSSSSGSVASSQADALDGNLVEDFEIGGRETFEANESDGEESEEQ